MSPGIQSPAGRLDRPLIERPGPLVLRLLPVGIGVQLIIDWLMGSSAEYFNAAHLLQAWAGVVAGGEIPHDVTFLIGQESLGGPVSLGIGTVVFFAQPALLLAAIIFPASALRRRRRRRTELRRASAP